MIKKNIYKLLYIGIITVMLNLYDIVQWTEGQKGAAAVTWEGSGKVTFSIGRTPEIETDLTRITSEALG